MLNSDHVPWSEFSKDFDLHKYVRLTLTDDDPSGRLLGIAFEPTVTSESQDKRI